MTVSTPKHTTLIPISKYISHCTIVTMRSHNTEPTQQRALESSCVVTLVEHIMKTRLTVSTKLMESHVVACTDHPAE